MLRFNLHALCKARGISSPNTFLVKSGFSRAAASRIMNGHSASFQFKQIERLCEVLHCEPNDLLEWRPEKGVSYADDFPLKKLIRDEKAYEWIDIMQKIPMDELEKLGELIVKKGKG